MTPMETLALRCLLPGFEGLQAPDWVLRRAAEGLGGVILFARNVESQAQVCALTAELHCARPELLIGIDEEGGDVTRLEARTGSSFPGNLALGVADDTSLTRGVASAIGGELAARGIDLNLAPVADVNSNPMNPVIGVRSFGADAGAVARHTAAYVEGMQDSGVAACAKHFPGHGDTSIDSHLELPVVGEDPRVRALAPFKSAIGCDVQAIMSAHVVAPAIDKAPATLSRRVMTGLLRHELGFRGLAVTDGLEMHGVNQGIGIAEGAVRALIAGCDALCVGGDRADKHVVDEIVDGVAAAVEQGRLGEGRLREAALRMDGVSAWRAARRGKTIPRGSEAGVGLVAARRAITTDGPVRVGDESAVFRFESVPSIAAGNVPWGVAGPLGARGVRVTAVEVDPAEHDLAVLLDESADKSVVLVVRDLHRRPAQATMIEALLARRPGAILVEMGVPICRPRGAAAYIATHGSARVCGEAAAQVLRP
jgi:beta-N-acetylhexosaminidase